MAYDPVRARETLVRLGKSGPARLRGPLGRASRRFRSGFSGPLVSIVVPVSDDGTTRVGPCLDTLIVQTHRNIDVVVVPYGNHERVLATVRSFAARDWRIRVLRRTAPDLAAARHQGIAAARGDLLVLAEAGDDFVPTGIATQVASHLSTGSPLVVGRLRQPSTVGWIPDVPLETAHLVDRLGTDLASSPVAITDLALGNKLFTRALWDDAGLRFSAELPTGVDVAIGLLRHAPRLDLLAESTYVPTGRRDGVGVGTTPDVLSGLGDWLEEHGRIWRLVEGIGLPEVSDWWRWGDLGFGVQRMIADVERADDEQFALLREHVETVLASAGEGLWARLGAEARVKIWLLRHGHRAALEGFLADRLFAEGSIATEVRDGRVRALLPLHDDTALGLPADLFDMSEDDTRLRVVLREVLWRDDALDLLLFASPDFVDLPETPDVAVALVAEDDGRRLALPVVHQERDHRANQGVRIHSRREQDASRGAVLVRVPLAEVIAASRGADGEVAECTWVVEVTLATQGLTRTATIGKVDSQSSAAFLGRDHLAPRPARDAAGSAVVALTPRSTSTGVRISPDRGPRLLDVAVEGRTVSGVLRTEDHLPAEARTVAVLVDGPGPAARAAVSWDADGGRFSLTVPAPRTAQRQWSVHAVTASGERRRLGWPAQHGAVQWLGVGGGEVVVSRGPGGGANVLEAADTFVVDAVERTGVDATVVGRWLGARVPAGAAVTLVGPKAVLDGVPEVAVAGDAPHTTRYRFRLESDPWGLGPMPVPQDTYPVTVVVDGRSRIAPLGERGVEALHRYTCDDVYSSRLMQFERDANLDLQRPLADDERGPHAQRRLQQWFATADLPLETDLVYLQSYLGASATDSQLAIHEELRRTRPDLRIVWGAHDASARVPDDAERVTMYTREWYRVLGTAAYLCQNIDPDRWFLRRPGQRLLQTFHGYPAKSMGLRMWRAKNFTPRRIDLELARTSGQWDLILTPAPAMDEHYRREYAYDGPIHSHGYPRDDALVAPDADARRAAVRARLGIAEHQRAVLYAPTWRDDLATNWREAEMVQHLDLAAAARELGPDYVLLMRGHRFHSGAAGRPGAGSATTYLDVTDYPEINDLILASDAAVLDYSSLRFDFALTMRPMVFLVPDLASYVGGVRGFLYDYRDSAPGPLVDTADEAVALLKDLPRLERDTAEGLRRFHDEYNRLQTGDSARRVVEAFFGPAPEAASGPAGQ